MNVQRANLEHRKVVSISPLLANIYLNRFDNYMTGDFERKKLKKQHSRRDGELNRYEKSQQSENLLLHQICR